jgi:hypothetical protein
MKKILLLVMCVPVMLAAQNGVPVSNLAADAGTVTFNVSWDKDAPNIPEVWSDSVWVFVDYNDGGVMKRLPLTGATLTNPSWSGASITQPNNQGAWVAGNARTANDGSFSATVQLLTATANFSGACVYASNYPPVAKYVDGKIKFTGTPPYYLVLNTGSVPALDTAYNSYNLLTGQTLDSFTDKTGAPGTITCVPSAVYELKASFAGFCPGDSVTFALSNAASERVYRLYNGSNPVDELTGQDGAATFTGAFAGAGTYTARVDADGTHCAAAMTYSHNIVANATPNPPTISVSPVTGAVCEKAGALVFTATDYTGALAWPDAGGGDESGNSVTFVSGTSPDTKTVKARSSQTYTNAPACLSAEVTQTGTINDLPTVTSFTGASRCGSGTVTLLATPSSDAAIEWYEVSTEGSILHTGNEFTPDVTATKTYYAQARNTSTNCVSASRTAVVATVIPNPVITTQPAADSSVCLGTTLTLEVVASPATAYQWKKNGDDVTGGTAATFTTAAVTANATYTVVVGNAGACSTTSDNALVSIKTTGCYDQIDASSCTGTINFTYISNAMSEGSMDWPTANTLCNSKEGSGWRLPTFDELKCICTKKGQLSSSFVNFYYWSSDYRNCDSGGCFYYFVYFQTCDTNAEYEVQTNYVKCVK